MTEPSNKTNAGPENQKSDTDNQIQKRQFGLELRKARESTKLTITDVAEKLLVSVEIITAIENSQAENLPALTFTKGYIRNYARLLEISADPIISAYLTVAPEQKQTLSTHSVLPMQASSSNFFIKMISLAIGVFSIAVLFFWLSQTDFTMDTNGSDKPLSTQQSIPSSIKPAKPPITIKQFEEQSVTTTEVKKSVVTSVEKKDVVEVKTTAIKPVDEALTKNETTSKQSENTVTESVQSNDVTVQTRSIKPGEQVVNSRALMSDEMILSAIESSWIEAKDLTGQRLYYQLLNAGEDIKLQGKSPFIVFLGNAKQVRIEINQKIVAFDHLVLSNKKTVNLKIEADTNVTVNPR